MRPRILAAVVAGLLLSAAVLGYLYQSEIAKRQEGEEIVLRPGDAALVSLGEDVYAAHCASCHGADLSGQENWQTRNANGRLPAPPHDETGHTWHHADEVLFQLTKYGPAALVGGDYESDMPAYDEVLSDREIVAVLSYIKSRWPEDVQARHDEINAR